MIKMTKRIIAVLVLAALLCTVVSGCSCTGDKTMPKGCPVSVWYYADGQSYTLVKGESGVSYFAKYISDDGSVTEYDCMLDDAVLIRAGEVIDGNGILSWDGFDKGCDSFTFTAKYPDGTIINANGSGKYPEGWEQGDAALREFFGSLTAEEACDSGVPVAADGEAALQQDENAGGTSSGGIVSVEQLEDGTVRITAVSYSGAVDIPDMYEGRVISSIGSGAFAGTGITSVRMGAFITEIEPGAFEGCTALSQAFLPDNLCCIPERTFAGCTALEAVTIHGGIISVEPYAFAGCSALREVIINEGVQTIGIKSFNGCGALERVELPSTVSYISPDAFEGCSGGMKWVVLEGTYAQDFAAENGIAAEVIKIVG